MAGLSITGQMKVSTLQEGFLKEFGLTLRVYDGREFADPSQTLAQVRKKKGSGKDLSVAKNMKVGNLEDKFEVEFGLKVQVAGSDDSYLCKNELTLNAAQQEDEKKLARKERKAARQAEASKDEQALGLSAWEQFKAERAETSEGAVHVSSDDDSDDTGSGDADSALPSPPTPQQYGAWRYYAPAYLESDDGETEIPLAIVDNILDIIGYSSIDEFNNEMNKYNRGEIPEMVQNKLRRIFLGHDEIIEEQFPESLNVEGVGELPSPLVKIPNPEPCIIEIYAISIEKTEDELFEIPIRIGISCSKFLAPKPDYERLSSLLIEGDAEKLNEDDRDVVLKWFSEGGDENEDFDEVFDSAATSLRETIEELMGIVSIDFEDEDGDEFVFYVTGEEEIGFSRSDLVSENRILK